MSNMAHGVYMQAKKDFLAFFTAQFHECGGNLPNMRDKFRREMIDLKFRLVNDGEHAMSIVQIKYKQGVTFDAAWKYACRGVTVIIDTKENSVLGVSWCLDKFFNCDEVHAKMGVTLHEIATKFETDGYGLAFTLKHDGSNIKMFCDQFGNIYAHTLGSCDPTVPMQKNIPGSPTFSQMSLSLITELYPELLAWMKAHPYESIVCELMTEWNKIVTKYNKNTITPLCTIGTDGIPRWGTLRKLCPALFDDQGFPLYSQRTTAASREEDFPGYLRMLEANPDGVGLIPEGAVVYAYKLGEDGKPDVCYAFCKQKSPEYKKLHLRVVLNPGTVSDFMNCQRLVVIGLDDDIGPLGREIRRKHMDLTLEGLGKVTQSLSDLIPTLIEAGPPRTKGFALAVKASTVAPWIKALLFGKNFTLSDDFNAEDFIRSALAADDCALLNKLQKTLGLHWWNAEPVEKKNDALAEAPVAAPAPSPVEEKKDTAEEHIEDETRKKDFKVFCDFDGTLVDEGQADDSEHGLKNLKRNKRVARILSAYNTMGAPIFILTGRDDSMTDHIRNWVKNNLPFHVEIICRPEHMKIQDHKTGVIQQHIDQGAKTIVHLENDSRVLDGCAKICNSQGVRYLGHFFSENKLAKIVTQPSITVMVALCDTMGTGKTSIFNLVQKHYKDLGIPVMRVSADDVYYDWSDEHYNRTGNRPTTPIPGELMFRRLMNNFRLASTCGGVALVDMVVDSAMIKRIMEAGVPYVLGTFMKTKTSKNKKGATTVEVDAAYLKFAKENALGRMERKKEAESRGEEAMRLAMNGSTLDCPDAADVVEKRSKSCLMQITTRPITQYAEGRPDIMGIEEAAQTLIADIESKRQEGGNMAARPTRAYLGVPVRCDECQAPPDFYRVRFPHITIAPPTPNPASLLARIGEPFGYKTTPKPLDRGAGASNVTIFHPAISSDPSDKTFYHITRHVQNGSKPVQAGPELHTYLETAEHKADLLEALDENPETIECMVLM